MLQRLSLKRVLPVHNGNSATIEGYLVQSSKVIIRKPTPQFIVGLLKEYQRLVYYRAFHTKHPPATKHTPP